MTGRAAFALALALACSAYVARVCAKEELQGHPEVAPVEETSVAARPAQVVEAVDFDAIPLGSIPPNPRDADTPAVVTKDEHWGGLYTGGGTDKKGARKRYAARFPVLSRNHDFTLSPDQPHLSALYLPLQDGFAFGGESIGNLQCHAAGTAAPLRWETVTLGADGNALLEITDLWFDSTNCAVGVGNRARVSFKAVAWNGTKPWLFAVRDATSVTFLMPRASVVRSDVLVGHSMLVSGGFTRVTLPLGRWNSATFAVSLFSLDWNDPAAPGAKPVPPSTETADVSVELTQTMTEGSPTVLVLRAQPPTQLLEAQIR